MFLDVLLGGLCAYYIILSNTGSGLFWFRRDTTDKPKGPRSGLHVLTDEATGVQYVVNAMGGMCPRIDRQGLPYQSR